MMRLRAATRASELARWQTDHVVALLQRVRPGLEVEVVEVSTIGDRDVATPIAAMGGKGVFVKEIQAAVLDGRADLAVHSGKDMPAMGPTELVVGAVPERADARDVLVGARLGDLRNGARIGTGSPRRRAQLSWLRPDLEFAEVRGNIATRLAKASAHDAIVLAAAALDRLGVAPEVVDPLPIDMMVPQVAQGALAIECRGDDAALLALLAEIEHAPTRRRFDTERAFLSELGGDCDLPAGAHAVLDHDDIVLSGVILSPDGRRRLAATRTGDDPESLGRQVARHLLVDAGGAALLGR